MIKVSLHIVGEVLLVTLKSLINISLRRIILFLACFMLVGSYYCFDIPAALKTQLKNYFGNPDDFEFKFSLMFTLYSAPNVCNIS